MADFPLMFVLFSTSTVSTKGRVRVIDRDIHTIRHVTEDVLSFICFNSVSWYSGLLLTL